MSNKWTSIIVADRITEAAETLKRLPNHHPGRKYKGAWPEFVRTSFAYSDEETHRIAAEVCRRGPIHR